MAYRMLQQVFRHLKKELPTSVPAHYRRIPLKKNDGVCVYLESRFVIQINKSFPEFYAVEVLLHEYAHALAWGKDKDVHGHNWGIAYSMVYRSFLQFLEKWESTIVG
jgi:hypothetical protein